jgi:hypothetical protein
MAFTTEDYVRLLSTDNVQEIGQYVGRNVTISLDEAEIFAAPQRESSAQRSRLPLIEVKVHEPEVVLGDRRQSVFAWSRTFVRNHENLIGESRF